MIDAQRALALAPDASSVAAAKKLAAPASWRALGRDARAVWGECRGSTFYRVGVALDDLASRCSCPSRKIPCKHALSLMLLAPSAPEGAPPDWLREWLDARAASAQRRQAREGKAPDPVARRKREEAREQRVDKGLDAFDRFLEDLVRTGLAGLESQPSTFEAQAARLVDAQAAGLAGRVRRLESLIGGAPDWPDRLLDRLGRLALLTHAFRRLDALEGPLVDDVRAAIGFNLPEREVLARGERVRDTWLVLAQAETDDERLRSQRSWLRGAATGRTALVLQFAPGMAPFPEALSAGSAFEGELAFFPSATPTRALIAARDAEVAFAAPPGFVTIAEALAAMAEELGKNPWQERVLFTLDEVVPVRSDGHWFVRDAAGLALPLAARSPTLLLAISGGHPVRVVGEWSGERLHALAALEGAAHHPLDGGDE